MKQIIFKGRLGKEFGGEFILSVHDVAEAVRALCYQIKGFEEALKQGQYKVTYLYRDHELDLDERQLNFGFGRAYGVRITPVASGAKKRGLGKIILGVALVAGAFIGAAMTGGLGATAFSVAGMSFSWGRVALMGGMMILSGVSQMLTPQVNQTDTSQDEKESFLFDGPRQVVEQGHPIMLVYGETHTGSMVISTGIATEEMPI